MNFSVALIANKRRTAEEAKPAAEPEEAGPVFKTNFKTITTEGLLAGFKQPPPVTLRFRSDPSEVVGGGQVAGDGDVSSSRGWVAADDITSKTPRGSLFSLCQRNRVATPPRCALRVPYARSRGRSQQRPRFQTVRCERLLREFVLNGILHDYLDIELHLSSKNLSSKNLYSACNLRKPRLAPTFNALPISVFLNVPCWSLLSRFCDLKCHKTT